MASPAIEVDWAAAIRRGVLWATVTRLPRSVAGRADVRIGFYPGIKPAQVRALIEAALKG